MPEPKIENQTASLEKPNESWEEKAMSHLETIYRLYPNNQKRLKDIKEQIKTIASMALGPDNKILDELDKCLDIENRDEFIQAIMLILQPIIDAKRNDPVKFEEAKRQAFLENGKFNSINDLMSYDIDEHTLHLHIAPNETTTAARKITMLKEGMIELAKIVRDNKDIQKITGASWIVAEHPEILTRLGFDLEGQISAEEKERFFAAETKDVHRASISRQALLNKYL